MSELVKNVAKIVYIAHLHHAMHATVAIILTLPHLNVSNVPLKTVYIVMTQLAICATMDSHLLIMNVLNALKTVIIVNQLIFA